MKFDNVFENSLNVTLYFCLVVDCLQVGTLEKTQAWFFPVLTHFDRLLKVSVEKRGFK